MGIAAQKRRQIFFGTRTDLVLIFCIMNGSQLILHIAVKMLGGKERILLSDLLKDPFVLGFPCLGTLYGSFCKKLAGMEEGE